MIASLQLYTNRSFWRHYSQPISWLQFSHSDMKDNSGALWTKLHVSRNRPSFGFCTDTGHKTLLRLNAMTETVRMQQVTVS